MVVAVVALARLAIPMAPVTVETALHLLFLDRPLPMRAVAADQCKTAFLRRAVMAAVETVVIWPAVTLALLVQQTLAAVAVEAQLVVMLAAPASFSSSTHWVLLRS
jgi:hypothetical protein